jgi:hypothetical protein
MLMRKFAGAALVALVGGGLLIGTAMPASAGCSVRSFTYSHSENSGPGGSTYYVYTSGRFTYYDTVYRGSTYNYVACTPQ